jgi:CMP-N-acetylneuraminic acid synthetase
MTKVVALLPMKGTSERVPNKNLKIFNGKPLYHIVMNTLLKSKFID